MLLLHEKVVGVGLRIGCKGRFFLGIVAGFEVEEPVGIKADFSGVLVQIDAHGTGSQAGSASGTSAGHVNHASDVENLDVG